MANRATSSARNAWETFQQTIPEMVTGMAAITRAMRQSGMDRELIELIKIRVSQLNGIAPGCVQYHLNDARKIGVSGDKLDLLATWREVPAYFRHANARHWNGLSTAMLAARPVGDDACAALAMHFNDVRSSSQPQSDKSTSRNRVAAPFRFTPPIPRSIGLLWVQERISTEMAASPRIIVVGGGLAGLAAVIKIAEAGGSVDLFSIVPVKRSHSVCAQGGINAAKNLKGEGDTTAQHFDDTIYGGDFLANQTPVKAMCEAAPAIIDLLDRMGVPFNRTPEGLLDFRRFGGTLYHRTAFAGATTGQQLLYALDEQVRRYEAEGKVRKFEGWEFLSAIDRRTRRVPWHNRNGPSHHGTAPLPCRCRDTGHRRRGSYFRKKHQLRRLHGIGAGGRLSAGRVTTPTASSSRCTPRRSPVKTSFASCRSRRAAKVAAFGFPRPRATNDPGSRSPRASASTSSKSGIQNTATSSRVTSPPAPSTRWFTNSASASMASRWSTSTSLISIAKRSTANSKAFSKSTRSS